MQKKSSKKPIGITLEDVIITMQRHHQEVIMRIDGLEKRMDGLEKRMDYHEALSAKRHAQNMQSFQTLDERLDDLEVKEIPRIKKVVGMR